MRNWRETWPRKKGLSDLGDSLETPARRRRFQAHRRCTCKRYLATNASPLPLQDLSTKDWSRSSNCTAIELFWILIVRSVPLRILLDLLLEKNLHSSLGFFLRKVGSVSFELAKEDSASVRHLSPTLLQVLWWNHSGVLCLLAFTLPGKKAKKEGRLQILFWRGLFSLFLSLREFSKKKGGRNHHRADPNLIKKRRKPPLILHCGIPISREEEFCRNFFQASILLSRLFCVRDTWSAVPGCISELEIITTLPCGWNAYGLTQNQHVKFTSEISDMVGGIQTVLIESAKWTEVLKYYANLEDVFLCLLKRATMVVSELNIFDEAILKDLEKSCKEMIWQIYVMIPKQRK
ncbi:hypothetical protein VNO77_33974 [Canavalia gladiata]|uniref:Uncharacterized protein n=1 Tax=Canavalia gladiata TaxID=3824 RepID=A0AAN9KFY3_CANGL